MDLFIWYRDTGKMQRYSMEEILTMPAWNGKMNFQSSLMTEFLSQFMALCHPNDD